VADALAEVDGVIAVNQAKHPDRSWRGYTVIHHVGKALAHVSYLLQGKPLDHDTKRRALAHAMGRLGMALQLELDEERRR
jgi:hypothetical protein